MRFNILQKLILKLKSRHPFKEHNCYVLYYFRKWALLGKFLGFFPVHNNDLVCLRGGDQTDDKKKRKRIFCFDVSQKKWKRYVSWSFLISVLVYIFFSTSILQPMHLYITTYIDKEIAFQSTDRFAIQVFLATVHILRSIAPMFPIIRYSRIIKLIRKMTSYDQTFNASSSEGCGGFVDFWIFLLFVGSIITIVTNWIVSEFDFVNVITTDEDPVFPLSYFLTRSKFFTDIFIQTGHVYAELAICFAVAVMRYISKFVEYRMKSLEEELENIVASSKTSKINISLIEPSLYPQNEPQPIMKNDDIIKSCSKIKNLIKILKRFNKTFQGYILCFFTFTVVLVIVSMYMIIIMIRLVSIIGGFFFLRKTKIARAFNALAITGTHSIYRMILLINIGDRIQSSVSQSKIFDNA